MSRDYLQGRKAGDVSWFDPRPIPARTFMDRSAGAGSVACKNGQNWSDVKWYRVLLIRSRWSVVAGHIG